MKPFNKRLTPVRIGPPLTISKEALLEGLDVYEECFQELF